MVIIYYILTLHLSLMKTTFVLHVRRLLLVAHICVATYTRDITRRRDSGFWMGDVLADWMLYACLYLADVCGLTGF